MSDDVTVDSIEFLVSLDTTTKPPMLKVTGNKYVDKSNGKQPLTWKLDGENLKGGEFVEGTACKPGFEWLSWPPPAEDIFDKAKVNKDKVDITDTHTGASSDGRWYYKLRVRLDGQIYETPMTAPDPVDVDEPCDSTRMLVGNNPVIINR